MSIISSAKSLVIKFAGKVFVEEFEGKVLFGVNALFVGIVLFVATILFVEILFVEILFVEKEMLSVEFVEDKLFFGNSIVLICEVFTLLNKISSKEEI